MISEATVLTEFSILESIPGIGEVTSALLLAELGDIQRFKTNKQLNAFVGIDIRRYQSGTIYKRDRIQKRGNKRARMILYYTVQNMIKRHKYIDNHIIDYYYKLNCNNYCNSTNKKESY
ncbi:IS110 family transposase [Aerococcaceae bacterium DSM 111022]|nr:IS110 family transposase [Aerococcaceae bacterium DSM 111022]